MALLSWHDGLPFDSGSGWTKASWLDGLIAPAYGAAAATPTSDATAAVATWSVPAAGVHGHAHPAGTASIASWVAPGASVHAHALVDGAAAEALWVAVDAEAKFGVHSTPSYATWVAPSGVPVPGPVDVDGVEAIASWVAPSARTTAKVYGTAATATWTSTDATGVPGPVDSPGFAAVGRWIAAEAGARVITAGSLHVTINGIEYASTALDGTPGVGIGRGSLTIDDKWGDPTTCNFVTRNIFVEVGQEVIITLQQVPLRQFAGVVLSHRRSYDTETFEHPREDVSCVSYAWILNEKKIIRQYLDESATDIAIDLMSDLTATFSTAGIEADLPVIGQISFGNVDRLEALKQLAAAFSGSIYVDYYQNLHLFLTEVTDAPEDLTTSHPTLNNFSHEVDWSQVVTRQYLEGGGAKVLAEIAPGETIIPVETTRWYEVDGANWICDFETPESGMDGEGFLYVSTNVAFTDTAAHAGYFGASFLKVGAVKSHLHREFDEDITCFATPGTESIMKCSFFFRITTMPTADACCIGGVMWLNDTISGLAINIDGTFCSRIGSGTIGSNSTAVLLPGTWYEARITALIHNDASMYAADDNFFLICSIYDDSGVFIEKVWKQVQLGSSWQFTLAGWELGAEASPSCTIAFDIDDAAYVALNDYAFPAGMGITQFHVTNGNIFNSPANDNAILSPSVNLLAHSFQRLRYRGRLHNPRPGSLALTSLVATAMIGAGIDVGEHLYSSTFVTLAGESLPTAVIIGRTTVVTPPVPPLLSAATGAGINPGEHSYAVTFVTADGETAPSALATITTGVLDPSIVPTLSATSYGTGPNAGSHKWAMTLVTAEGETTLGSSVTKVVGTCDAPPAPTCSADNSGSLTPGTYKYALVYEVDGAFTEGGGQSTYVVGSAIAAPTEAPSLGYEDNTGVMGGHYANSAGYSSPYPDATVGRANSYKYTWDYGFGSAGPYTAPSPALDYSVEPLMWDSVGPNGITARVGQSSPWGPAWSQGEILYIPVPSDPRVRRVSIWRASGDGTYWAYTGYTMTHGGSGFNMSRPGYVGVRVWANYPIAYKNLHLGQITPVGDGTKCTVSWGTAPTGVSKIHVYRTDVGGSAFKLIHTQHSGAAGSYSDSGGAGGAAMPTVNNTTGFKRVTVSMPAGPTGVTQRKLWRTKAGGSTFYLLYTLGGNTAYDFLDTVTDGTLPATEPPVTNTAIMERYNVTVTAGEDGVTKRRLYRTAAGDAQLKLLHEFTNNTTLTYLDAYADATLGADAPTTNTAIKNKIRLTHIPIGPVNVIGRNLYRSAAGAADLKLLHSLTNNSDIWWDDTVEDVDLGAAAPTEDLSGLPTTDTSGIVAVGGTSIQVADPTTFPRMGGWIVVNGTQYIRYTSVDGNRLIGIPTTGSGSVTVNIPSGSTIACAPQLVGIPATGDGAITQTILEGDQVNTVIRYTDTTAQATWRTMLEHIGSDGIKEDYTIDNRLSLVETKRRCRAMLDLKKVPEVKITWESRDTLTRAGKTIHVDLQDLPDLPDPTMLHGDFKIQSVQVSQFDEAPNSGLMPLYRAQGSSKRFTLDDLLRLTLLGRT